MRKKLPVTLMFLYLLSSTLLYSQAPAGSPVEHMEYFSKREQNLSEKYLSYISEVAHGGRARKMEKRREDLLASIRESLRDAGKLKPYKGDASLRDAYKEYWSVLQSIFNEDYHKIVDMEEVAERSYDAMEAFLLMQEKAGERLHQAHEKVSESQKEFAARNNVRLLESESTKLNKRIAQAGNVSGYMNKIYLVMFKSSVQETLMMEALNAKNVNGVEQGRVSMLKFAEEGLSRIDTMKTYNGDGSLKNTCKKVLEFHKLEGGKMTAAVDFLVKHEEFEKLKKSFDAKPANKRTKADIDNYNKAATDYTKDVNDYNKMNQELNNGRSKAGTQWETARKRFMDQHAPYKI